MPSPQPPADNDVRLRKSLADALPEPVWPPGLVVRPFEYSDARALHALFDMAFEDQAPFEDWWPKLSGDAEFDPTLCFLAFGPDGRLLGGAQCWTSGYVKDLAVHPDARGKGLGEALMLAVFRAFRDRGAAHVDLKTNRIGNAAAYRLYRRLGMTEVDWGG